MPTYIYKLGEHLQFCQEFVGDQHICILDPGEVSDNLKLEAHLIENKLYSKTHADGWTISAYPEADYYVWITKFTAVHAEYGTIDGDLEKTITTTHKKAFKHFTKNHKIVTFDMGDI